MSAKYGLIGFPLEHSFSPGWFSEKFSSEGIDAGYQSYPMQEVGALPRLLAAEGHQLKGLNVTIPHKQSVIPFLDALDETATAVGAVNCIRIKDGVTEGYNTDVVGFEQSLRPLLRPHHTAALVLGTGGASLAVAYVLRKLGIAFTYVSRRKQPGMLTYKELDKETLAEHKLVINTTPLGMYPDIDACPELLYRAIGTEHLLYDLVYNPAETLFLTKGKQQGATTKNGQEMLELQARASWDIWNQ